jgi:hypothetical protein
MKNKFKIVILILVPLVFLVIGFSFDRTKYGTDPESAYLMNGININMLKSVGHFDNPGTTVQIYSAAVLRIVHTFRFSGTDLQTDVLLHSEYYIEALRYSLILMNALVLFLLGFVASTLFGNIWLALVLQLTPFLSDTLTEEMFTKIAPEPFLFATVSLLAMLLFKYYTYDDKRNKRFVILFALLSAFGLVTKMTYLPFLIIPFIVLEGWNNKIRYSLLITPGFVLFTLPAIKGYPYMAKWFLNLGTHTGTYGQGSVGIIDPSQYVKALVQIAITNKELLVVTLIAAIILLVKAFGTKKDTGVFADPAFRILTAMLVAVFASILMVAKHYHSNHYLFPALSLLGPLLVFMYLLLIKGKKENPGKYSYIALPVLVGVILVASLLHVPYLSIACKGYRMSNQDTEETMQLLDRDYKDYVKTYYFPTSFNVYSSLRWGNVYSRQFHTERLKQLYPEGLFYNAWDKSFQLWETSFSPGEFVAKYGGKILLIGGPRTDEEMKMVEDGGLKLKKLYEGRLQVIYEVDTALSPLFHGKIHLDQAIWTLKNDLETISSDKLWIMTGDEKFCKNTALSTDKSRSGRNSLLLPWAESYALNYELENLKPGQAFEISIWRNGGDNDAYLVAAAKNAASFYAQSKDYLEKDANGWEKINLSIRIPDNFTGKSLNIYLWNHGGKPAWFDDFEIVQYK